MSRRLLVMLLAAWPVQLHAADRSERPNILFILADDLGKEWLSCYGSEHRTPNMDRLAEGGLRFENVWATPLCTPTRVLMFTGRYPFHTGWTIHHDSPRWGGVFFDWNKEIAFSRQLKAAGYATAMAGKWQVDDLRRHPDCLRQHGFDEWCAWVGFEAGNPPSAERYFNPFIQDSSGRRGTQAGQFGPDVFRNFLIDFMARHKDGPFLAYYAMVLPHTPFTRTPHKLNTTARGIDLFPGMVDYCDYEIGCLVKALDDLKIRDRTLVIFTSDNGTVSGVECRARGRLVDGGKGGTTERGICVPFIANWPGRTPAGKVTNELVDFSDMFPTLVGLAGAESPENVAIDGKSFLHTLLGRKEPGPRREWIYSRLGPKQTLRDERFKWHQDGRLYDLQADPWEEHDMAGSGHPDARRAIKKLSGVFQSFPKGKDLPFSRPAGNGE
ncbi:MAG TPA: sulfatase-like hydrolase/transferase [Phycisphaerae bacterium]|nr:sulfatase-like hydrolase/transferase [Phycisphaerae bacterium]